MELPIKGMVCMHCVEAAQAALNAAGFSENAIARLGFVNIPDSEASIENLNRLDNELKCRGLSRITDPDVHLIEQVKITIIEHVRDEDCHFNLSACIEEHLNVDYATVSKLFSAIEGRTIEKYHIALRIEYVKELLSYGELNISEIADKAGYSSVAHLSRQFKSVTGLTPSAFLKGPIKRIPLNEV